MSKKYSNRVRDLKEIRKALNFFEEKIKFTYEPIPDVFEEISKKMSENIGKRDHYDIKEVKYLKF